MSEKQPARRPSTIKGQTNLAPPWEPCEVSIDELSAIHALVVGEASKDQQFRFLEWFKRATAVNEMEFRPSGERESNFAAGKRFVGIQVFTLAKSHLPTK
jgi:hypothetical protein